MHKDRHAFSRLAEVNVQSPTIKTIGTLVMQEYLQMWSLRFTQGTVVFQGQPDCAGLNQAPAPAVITLPQQLPLDSSQGEAKGKHRGILSLCRNHKVPIPPWTPYCSRLI